jgi:hypothetical protein
MVLHSGPEEQLLASGSTPRKQGEDYILDGYGSSVMPFGLCNAPAIFESLMETAFEASFTSQVVYLDDMIVIGRIF